MEHTASKTETQELSEKIATLRHDVADLARTARDRAVHGTTDWVKEHPFRAVGVAAGIGVVMGLAIGVLAGRNR